MLEEFSQLSSIRGKRNQSTFWVMDLSSIHLDLSLVVEWRGVIFESRAEGRFEVQDKRRYGNWLKLSRSKSRHLIQTGREGDKSMIWEIMGEQFTLSWKIQHSFRMPAKCLEGKCCYSS